MHFRWSYNSHKMIEYVKISEFKRQMGTFLGRVRKGGEIVLTDREHPVAKVLRFQENEAEIRLLPPSAGFAKLPEGPKAPLTSLDVVSILRDNRDRR